MQDQLLAGFKERVRALYSFRGYFERYYEIYAEHGAGPEAFEALEREYFEIFGANKYKDYQVFRAMRWRYANSLRKKAKKNNKV